MSILRCKLDDSNYVPLENGKIIDIDIVTSNFKDGMHLVHAPAYEERIGIYIYDNYSEDSNLDINNSKLLLTGIVNDKEKEIINTYIPFISLSDINSLDIIYNDRKELLDIKFLEKKVIGYNRTLKRALKELSKYDHYYFYLRLLESYYYNKSSKKLLRK